MQEEENQNQTDEGRRAAKGLHNKRCKRRKSKKLIAERKSRAKIDDEK